ncbi:hypothetical protein PSPO01_16296 [Paraphaeosphaeria sporulosa]
MSSQQQSRISAWSRRAANNNYQKLSKTLCEKLAKLCLDYDTQVYFLAYRNGRFNGFGKYYPAPVIKTPGRCYRASQRERVPQRSLSTVNKTEHTTGKKGTAD